MVYFYAILYHVFIDKWLVIWYTESDLWITYEEGGEDRSVKDI